MTFTATVIANDPIQGTPTGTVQFYIGGNWAGDGTLSDGVATFSIFSLDVGSHGVTAVYGGDSTFDGSNSDELPQTVNKADTSTALTSDQQDASYGTPLTFTATVWAVSPGAGTPTGTVTFYTDSSAIGSATVDSNGVATLTISTLDSGSRNVTATYEGDDHFHDSSSDVMMVTVNAVNQAPVVTTPYDQFHSERDQVFLVIEVVDPDGDELIFAATGLPDGLSMDALTGIISGTLNCDAAGTYAVTVSVTDVPAVGGPLTTDIYFTWEVAEVGHALVIWTGLGDGTSWHDPANWDINDIPQHCDDVLIDAPGTTVVHDYGDVTIHSLTLFVGSTLNFTGNLTLGSDSVLDGLFTFSGVLSQLTGILTLAGGGQLAGQVEVAEDAEIEISNHVVDVLNGTNFTGPGIVSVLGNGTANILGAVTVANFTLGQAGTVDGDGNLTINGTAN